LAAGIEDLDDEHAAATEGQGWASGCAAAGSISTVSSAAGVASAKSSRTRAIVSARLALANKP